MEGEELVLPEELTVLPRWVRWEYHLTSDGKNTKVPLTEDGTRLASTTDPTTWTNYNALHRPSKIGFVFVKSDGLVGIDLDHVLTSTGLPAWARTVVSEASSYTEISPSGEGLHIIGRGAKPAWLPNRTEMPGDSGLEVYDHARFFTMTGHIFEGHQALHRIDLESVLGFLRPLHNEVPHRRILWLQGPSAEDQLSIHAIIPGVKEERRMRHPFHDSSTGANFMVDKGGLTWRCWRHGFTGNALHLLGIGRGIIACGERPSKEQWRVILRLAREQGLIADAHRRPRRTLRLVPNE